jgi:transcriptional regulator with GAF, ATPase, and Fis domain
MRRTDVSDSPRISPADLAFLAISPSLARDGDAGQVVDIALTTAVSLANAQLGWLFLLDREMRHLYRRAAYSPDGDGARAGEQGDTMDIDDPSLVEDPLVYCLRSGGPVRIDDLHRYSGFSCDRLRARTGSTNRSASLLAVPIREHSGTAIGVLALSRVAEGEPARPFDDPIAQDVHRFAEHMATAMVAFRLMVEKDTPSPKPGRARAHPPPPPRDHDPFSGVIGDSPAMRAPLALARRVAPTDVTVFLLGETGTGKEVLARAIHGASNRANAPFIAQNCAAIPETLLEAELFGWKKGAFSGATSDRPGLFVEASKGTLFLDELGDMPLPLQAKLLRVLQERCVRPLGGQAEMPIDTRIIAATHRDLEACLRAGVLRADLYYRLAVFPVDLPPLRARREDIPRLLDHFSRDFAKRHGGDPPGFSPSLLDALIHHDWPGNIRELRNLVERAALLGPEGEDSILQSLVRPVPTPFPGNDAPDRRSASPSRPPRGTPLKDSVARFEADMIRQCLRDTGGSLKEAAQELGLPRRTLADKIRRYGLGEAV